LSATTIVSRGETMKGTLRKKLIGVPAEKGGDFYLEVTKVTHSNRAAAEFACPGTIVQAMVIAGRAQVGSQIELRSPFEGKIVAMIKSIEQQGKRTKMAKAGTRVGICLTDVRISEIRKLSEPSEATDNPPLVGVY